MMTSRRYRGDASARPGAPKSAGVQDDSQERHQHTQEQQPEKKHREAGTPQGYSIRFFTVLLHGCYVGHGPVEMRSPKNGRRILVYTFSPLQIQSAVCRRPPIAVVELGASRLQQIKTDWHAQSMPCAPTGARETDALASLGLERSRVGVLSCVVFLATTMSAGLAVEGQLRGARKQPTSSPS